MHRVLVIGCGSIGERHVRCLLRTERATVGVCEINDSLRNRIGEAYGLTDLYTSLDDALAGSWNAAVIATPAHTHIPIARQLIGAGIHILLEKPLSTSLDGIGDLQVAVRQKGVTAAVAYVYRAHPAVRALKAALDSGTYGKPLELVAMCGQHFPFYRPAYREIYYTDHAKGGGAIQDALTHVLNAGEWLVGPITHLAVDAAHLRLEGVEVEDTVHVLTRQGAVMGSYTLNQHQTPNENTITVIAERGTLRCELHTSRLRIHTDPAGEWTDEVFELKDRDEWFVRQTVAFLDAVEGTATPLCTLEEGLQTLRVNLAALRMYRERGSLKALEEG